MGEIGVNKMRSKQEIDENMSSTDRQSIQRELLLEVLLDIRELLKTNQVSEDKDSMELGAPTKGGKIKLYGDYSDSEGFKTKIDKAHELQSYAQAKLNL